MIRWLMDEVLVYCAGLDVHRAANVAVRQGHSAPIPQKLVASGDWLMSHRVSRVGLESSGCTETGVLPPGRSGRSGVAAQYPGPEECPAQKLMWWIPWIALLVE